MLKDQMYLQYLIAIDPTSEVAEMLIAQLSELGVEGFEEQPAILVATGKIGELEPDLTEQLLNDAGLKFTKKEVQNQNWNAIWESSFEPVLVDEFAGVRAGFHTPMIGVKHEIIITPKMSFGTGHHATTWLMMNQMETIDFQRKTVLDFGTGTGVLAILAEKLGAAKVTGLDNDEWSIDNAAENLTVNNTSICSLVLADSLDQFAPVDVLLANINKHVILGNIAQMKSAVNPNGFWLLSGLLEIDEEDVLKAAVEAGMKHHSTKHRNGWISMIFLNVGNIC